MITDALLDNFREALRLIGGAVTGNTSTAAYLHGSFGAGKSHFMAVLHALLRGAHAARDRDEFAGLLAENRWLDGRRFLLVPYHLIGAKSIEQRVLGNYVEYVRALHPDAPIPRVYRSDALLDNARNIRARIGDAEFIRGLPGGGTPDPDDPWGDAEAWTTSSLDAAFAAGRPGYDDKGRRSPRMVAARPAGRVPGPGWAGRTRFVRAAREVLLGAHPPVQLTSSAY